MAFVPPRPARAGQRTGLEQVALLQAVGIGGVERVLKGIQFRVRLGDLLAVAIESEGVREARRVAGAKAARELDGAHDVAKLIELVLRNVAVPVGGGVLKDTRRVVGAAHGTEAGVGVGNRPPGDDTGGVRATETQRHEPVGVGGERVGIVLRDQPGRAADRNSFGAVTERRL